MMTLTPHMLILVGVQPIDFRCGMDRLAAICHEIFCEDVKAGAVFVFRNRQATAIKLLVFDGSGTWLCQKRFSRGRLRWWPETELDIRLSADELAVILGQGSPRGVFKKPWRSLLQGDVGQKTKQEFSSS